MSQSYETAQEVSKLVQLKIKDNELLGRWASQDADAIGVESLIRK